MVNFESEQLLTTNKGEILNLIVLGRRDELLNTFQVWRESCISNSASEKTQEYKLRSCLFTIFLELERPLDRNLDKEAYLELKNFVNTKDDVEEKDILKAYSTINTFLDKINLTKIDTKKNFDSRNLEAENKEKGL